MDKKTFFEEIVKNRAAATEIYRQHKKISTDDTLTILLETLPHIVLILNRQRQIVWANHCLLAAIKQKNTADYLGHRPGDVFHCVNAMTAEQGCGTAKECQVCGALIAILQSLNGQGADEECMLLTTENDTLNLRFKARLIQVGGEEFDAVSIVDISGEKNKRMLERLFFHDIMNLAGSIQGFTDLLPELIDENSKHLPDTLTVLANSAGDLIELIKCQKDLLSAETNELSVYGKEIHVKQLVDTINGLFERNEAYRDRSITLHPIQHNIVLRCDERLLKRVIVNAIKNAMEAIDKGDTVDLIVRAENNIVLFEIHNKSFIPQEVQGRIFRKSFSTKSRDRGIGTYSIKLFTEKYLKGKVWFSSTPEQGTTFYVQIPNGNTAG